jgi:aerobic carbon-monoxide dehydrogenase small subunit
LTLNPLRRLIDVLREDCGLTAIKEGCGEGECGACSILMDGRVVDSCILPVGAAQGRTIETLESIRETTRGEQIVTGLARGGGVQCGFCTPGMAVAIESLLREDSDPDERKIREGLSGNLCRCTGYQQIVEGVLDTAARLRENGA